MTPSASQEALRAYLRGQGTDPEMIERHVARLGKAPTVSQRIATLMLAEERAILAGEPPRATVSRGTIVLPWSALASDNQRHTRFAAHSKAYVAAREKAHERAAEQWPGAAIVGAVRVTILVTPPNHARRDIGNFAKLTCDALTGVAYADDAQIAELTIRRGPVDVDRPRAEITVEAIDTCS